MGSRFAGALVLVAAGCGAKAPLRAPASAADAEIPPPTPEESRPLFAAIAGRSNEIQRCYDDARAARPEAYREAGTLKVRLIVGADGAVKRAEVAATTLERPEVGACVVGLLRATRFPARPTGRDVRLGYTLGFEPP
jgi:predicted small lipoprotein YifL